jgi:hypothetical protein
MIRGPLVKEMKNPYSPVRRFFDERFTAGLHAVQHRYRQDVPPLAVAPAPYGTNPATLDAAAHWLLRFLLDAQPDLSPAVFGAIACTPAALDALPALATIAHRLGTQLPQPGGPVHTFTGPTAATTVDPILLARGCWVLALLSEVYRGGLVALIDSPLGQFMRSTPTANNLLQLAPPAALDQLADLREVFETTLIPRLAHRKGPWALGPNLIGSRLLNADADVIAAGLLLDAKTNATSPSLAVADLFQIIGYALLDVHDAFRLDSVAVFNARYNHLATWHLETLLAELSGGAVEIPTLREQFRALQLSPGL